MDFKVLSEWIQGFGMNLNGRKREFRYIGCCLFPQYYSENWLIGVSPKWAIFCEVSIVQRRQWGHEWDAHPQWLPLCCTTNNAQVHGQSWGAGMVICYGARCKWFAYGPADATLNPPIISCFIKIQNGLPFWCRLTQVVVEKRPLNAVV